MFGGKRGGLQAEEHHPNREAQGWQHPVVGVLCCMLTSDFNCTYYLNYLVPLHIDSVPVLLVFSLIIAILSCYYFLKTSFLFNSALLGNGSLVRISQ